MPDRELGRPVPDPELGRPVPDPELGRPVPDPELGRPVPDRIALTIIHLKRRALLPGETPRGFYPSSNHICI